MLYKRAMIICLCWNPDVSATAETQLTRFLFFLFSFQFDKYAPKLDNPYFRHSNVSAYLSRWCLC